MTTAPMLAQWRKSERQRLLALRQSLSPEIRQAQTAAMLEQLDTLIPDSSSALVGVYWPIRGEPDLRTWMKKRAAQGLRLALPVAVQLGQPLEYRQWRPGSPLAHGLWGIPYPADGIAVTPDLVIAPLVGYDPRHYRLGYGGGFFDRTLAALHPRPRALGIGYPCTAIDTIHPQPHDIPMDHIVNGVDPP